MQHARRDDRTYTLTVYVAAPGTTIRQADGSTQPSLPGHVYYALSDGVGEPKGYGFAPEPSALVGPGKVNTDEFSKYEAPVYARTMQITREQYGKLDEFGVSGVQRDDRYFNLGYHFGNNSCVDFVWAGLNHAGLSPERRPMLGGQPIRQADFEGQLLPTDNIAAIRSIPAPFPDSPYNSETRHALPQVRQAKDAIDDVRGRYQDANDKVQDGLRNLVICRVFKDAPGCPEGVSGLSPPGEARGAPLVNDARHPFNDLFREIRGQVHALDWQHGREPDQRSEQLAAALVGPCRQAGMAHVCQVVLSKDGSRAFALDTPDFRTESRNRADVDVSTAVATPVEVSTRELDRVNVDLAQREQLAQQQQPDDRLVRSSPVMA